MFKSHKGQEYEVFRSGCGDGGWFFHIRGDGACRGSYTSRRFSFAWTADLAAKRYIRDYIF